MLVVAAKSPRSADESEWRTRKLRIDPLLDACGWRLGRGTNAARRTEEEETDNGPADYALWLEDRIVGIVEAKRLSVSPDGVLTQAERYALGLRQNAFDFRGLRTPFLYSTNGEVIRFHDVRDPLNLSRQVVRFHTPDALREMLDRDHGAGRRFLGEFACRERGPRAGDRRAEAPHARGHGHGDR